MSCEEHTPVKLVDCTERTPDVPVAKNAAIDKVDHSDAMQGGSGGEDPNTTSGASEVETTALKVPPVLPLGHSGSTYYFLSPSGQVRHMSADALEAGRGVKALFLGKKRAIDWCRKSFPDKRDEWSAKEAGLWIIEQCNLEGIYHADSKDIRSIGIWRGEDGKAVLNCGDRLMLADGQELPLPFRAPRAVYTAGPSLRAADTKAPPQDAFKQLLNALEDTISWKNKDDAIIWLGWVAAAALGGFPHWRCHLYVYGNRGCGKSELINLAGELLGDFGGDVMNDATEAALRQSRNNMALPILIDEFEPSESGKDRARQTSIIVLLRRMAGGQGGRITRGGSDHVAVSFRTLGAAYLSSINHIHFQPQDRSRFVTINLRPHATDVAPAEAASKIDALRSLCRNLSPKLRGRMLDQSKHWDQAYSEVKLFAREAGADARQAERAASILTAFDLLLFDEPPDRYRLEDLREPLALIMGDVQDCDATAEGRDALDHMLNAAVQLDHGVSRLVRELLRAVLQDEQIEGSTDPEAALSRVGLFIPSHREWIGVRIGQSQQISKIFGGSKWRDGAHKTSLLQLPGVEAPSSGVRFGKYGQHRVLTVPLNLFDLGLDHDT